MGRTSSTARRRLGEILAGDAAAHAALAKALPALAELAGAFAATLENGGRVAYLGAGTSGRLGALDAAELLPTFGIGPDQVGSLMAGGRRALWRAAEGAEDDQAAARRAVGRWEAGPGDLAIGISASGRTPWTVAGLRWAKERGARAGCLTCRSGSPLAAAADLPVEIPLGAEWLEGSTRMASGGVQRAALTALSTTAAAAVGAITGRSMTRVVPTNDKLRRRAEALVADLGGVDAAAARRSLQESGWRVEVAVLLARGMPMDEAERRLAEEPLASILA